ASHWAVALVPFFGDVGVGETLEPRWEKAVLIIGKRATPAVRRRLFYALLEIEWFPPKAGSVLWQKLASSASWQKTRRWVRLQRRVEHVKERMRREGLHPKGGIAKAAHEEVAAKEGTTGEALERGLRRFKKRSAVKKVVRK